MTGYLHIANSIPKCCRVTDDKQEKTDERNAEWHAIVDKLNPTYVENLDQPLDNMSYSCVEDYQRLSDEITNDTWDDATKVYAFARYMTDNYANDSYQVKRLFNLSRGTIAKDADNPKYWIYTSHVGMCQDFMNAMVIMCRHHNIPCTSLAGDNHVIPIVWIDNEWVGIDVNPLLPKCTQKDTDPTKWEYPEYYRWNRFYGTMAYRMPNIGIDIDEIP